jgi:nucleotide-binding universal stress UspA family protein
MITFSAHKILIPIDFSETAKRAIKHGVAIAKLFDSEIILLHVQKKTDLVEVVFPAMKIEGSLMIQDFLETKIEKIAEKIRKENNLTVVSKVVLGNIVSEISEMADETEVGLIIMGTHGSDSTGDFLLGSNSYRVLNNSRIPVMTVRHEISDLKYKNILLPIDSSDHSRQKVNSAIKIAEKLGARLHILGLLGEYEDNYEYKLKVILPQIEKLASKEHVLCTTHIDRDSNLVDKTLEYADKVNADLIVIMSDQRAGIARILGTYAHQLINNARVPILSFPPEVHPELMEEPVMGGLWSR